MKRKILAIPGSTRASSSNLHLISAIAGLSSEFFRVEVFSGLTSIPHFNPDIDHEEPPAEVKVFRQQVMDMDGLLICTPEYALGVPGTLKNALDWIVSSGEISGKPVALITASLSGQKAHESMLGTLHMLNADLNPDTQLVIPFVKTKVRAPNIITDTNTLEEIKQLIKAFAVQLQRVP